MYDIQKSLADLEMNLKDKKGRKNIYKKYLRSGIMKATLGKHFLGIFFRVAWKWSLCL